MKKNVIVAVALSLAAGFAQAERTSGMLPDVGVSAKVGTAGLGVDFTAAINDNFKVRAGYSSYEYSTNHTEENIDYDAKLRLAGFSLLADYHPWAGGFRVTAGGYAPKHRIGGAAKYTGPTSTVTVNGNDYSSTDLQDLTLDAKWKGNLQSRKN